MIIFGLLPLENLDLPAMKFLAFLPAFNNKDARALPLIIRKQGPCL